MKRINTHIIFNLTQTETEWYDLRDRVARNSYRNYNKWIDDCCTPMEEIRGALDSEYSFLS